MDEFDKMYETTRGGVRGGRDQFKWENVKEDKHRENYLGNSVMAPVGRWQKGKDLTWYAKESKEERNARREEEIRRIKQAEEDALAEALGYTVKPRQVSNVDAKDLKAALKREIPDGGEDDLVGEADEINGIGFMGNYTSLTGKVESGTFTAGGAIPGSVDEDSRNQDLETNEEHEKQVVHYENTREVVKPKKKKKEKKHKESKLKLKERKEEVVESRASYKQPVDKSKGDRYVSRILRYDDDEDNKDSTSKYNEHNYSSRDIRNKSTMRPRSRSPSNRRGYTFKK